MPSKVSIFGNRIRSGSIPTTALTGGILSSSAQLPTGILSSSTQINALSNTSTSFAETANNLNGGTANYIPLWTNATAQSSSNIFQSAGNIGIGTTNPVSRLTVNGDITITGSNSRIRGDFTNSPISSRLIFQTNNTTNGSTSVYVIPNASSPNASLAVANDSDVDNASVGLMSINAAEFRINSSKTGSGTFLPFTVYTSGSERLRVDTLGRVGIGTTTASATLDVDGNINISGSARRIRADFSTGSVTDRTMFQTNVTNGNTIIYTIPNGTGQATSLVIGNNSSVEDISLGVFSISTSNVTLISNRIGTGAFLPLTFQTSGSERVRISTDGRVGVGTTGPSASLQIQGNVSASSYTSSLNNQVGFFGTSSWAVSSSQATSASFATTSSFARTGSFATTASAATSITFTPTTASFANVGGVAIESSITSASFYPTLWNGSTSPSRPLQYTTAFRVNPNSGTAWIGAVSINSSLTFENNGPFQCNDAPIIRPRFTDYAETYTTPSISGNVLTLNIENGNVFRTTLNANITTLTISNPSGTGNACSFTLIFDANGSSYTVTWPAAVKWPGGTAPTLTTTNGRSDMFVFYTNNAGTTWYAMTAAQNFVTT